MIGANSCGIYLYAIIPTREEIIFNVAGVGAQDNEVYTIGHDCLAAVASTSQLAEYRGLKRDEAVPYLVAHQRVIETIMQNHPLLPIKFGTVLADEAQVRRFLAQGASLFHTALNQYADLMQMEVVVFWNPSQVFQQIAQEEPIIHLKNKLSNRPPEETMEERVALGQLVLAALERQREVLRVVILPVLKEVALDIMANPLMDDTMVVNVALLVDASGRKALEQKLEALDAAFERGECKTPGTTPLTFRCVGPLPPYSFATVEAQSLTFDAIEAARRYLNLEEEIPREEIKKAYRRLAGQSHPDRNPNTPGLEAHMSELTHAYQLLSAYAGAQFSVCSNYQDPNPVCSFSREAVEQTLLIAIRRQDIMA
jgi:hypothetical protein